MTTVRAPVAGGLGAILLAGGRATRVDGAAKPLFEVGGRTLLSAAVTAATDAGARPVTVVAPILDPGLDVTWVREDPPFGGPAAAIVAALAIVDMVKGLDKATSIERVRIVSKTGGKSGDWHRPDEA